MQLVQTPLWDHQQEEITRLERQPRVLIGWQMGSGKTLGAIERDLRIRKKVDEPAFRTLIVTPLATHDQWQRTIEREVPGAKVIVIDPKDRDAFLSQAGQYYIMHYEALRLMPELRGVFQHGIFDECHRLKNRKAKQTVAAKKLKIPFITDMSGSPADNHPADFWSILNHLWPKAFGSYNRFIDNYVEYEIGYPNGFKKLLGPKPAWIEKGLPAIAPAYSRVLKADVMKHLPPKVRDTIYVDLYPEQRELYDQMRDEMIAWVKAQRDELEPLVATAAIAKLVRLQQFAIGTMNYYEDDDVYRMTLPSSKLDRIADEITENPDEQFVVFSQFKGPLILLDHVLKRRGSSSVKHTGDESQKVRKAARDSFSQGRVQCFLSTIRAGGEGIDGLHNHCSRMFFVDLDWNPSKNEQAEDRLHRGGQEFPVQITTVVARNTVDFGRSVTISNKKEWLLQMLGDK